MTIQTYCTVKHIIGFNNGNNGNNQPEENQERRRNARGEHADAEFPINFEVLGLRGPIYGVLTYCSTCFHDMI